MSPAPLHLEIADATGELWTYRLTVLAETPLRVRLQGGPHGETYCVEKPWGDWWVCDCPDHEFRYRRARLREPGAHCKHIEAVILWRLSMSDVIVHERPAPPPPALVPGHAGALAQALLGAPRPALAKALAAAVKACAAVPPDRRNEHHRYDYTSSEAIIAEGRQALAGAGLVLLPVEAALVGSDREGADRYELVRTLILMHESGECAPLRVVWPVCPQTGRPLDKATAAADTLSLAYLLRDLLLMARVAEADDDAARGDRQPEAQPQRAAARKTAAADAAAAKKTSKVLPDPTSGAELAERLAEADRRTSAKGWCPKDAMTSEVLRQMASSRISAGPLAAWKPDAVKEAWEYAVDVALALKDDQPVGQAHQDAFDAAARTARLAPVELMKLADLDPTKPLTWRGYLAGLDRLRRRQAQAGA